MTWDEQFVGLYERSLERYQAGDRDYQNYYSEEDLAFLSEIGYKKREFFDFIEDYADEGTPSMTTALLVAAVRRDYLHTVQNGEQSSHQITRDELPGFGEELAGFAYLPRILAKARAKLKGELDPDMMYGCGGDRNFLRKNGAIHPADFLRHVWAAENDNQKIVTYLKSQAQN